MLIGDLIVLGLPYSVTVAEQAQYFGQFGKLSLCKINTDSSGHSAGYGFRYTDWQSQESVYLMNHRIRGGVVEVKYSRKVRLSSVKHLHCMYEL